jgi:hypothetical protein
VDVHNGKTSAKVIKEDLPAKCYTGSGVQVSCLNYKVKKILILYYEQFLY